MGYSSSIRYNGSVATVLRLVHFVKKNDSGRTQFKLSLSEHINQTSAKLQCFKPSPISPRARKTPQLPFRNYQFTGIAAYQRTDY